MKRTVITRPLFLTAAAIAVLALTSCVTPLPSTPSTPSNWYGYFALPIPIPCCAIGNFTSTLQFTDTATGTMVTGTVILHPHPSNCVPDATSEPVTGTIDISDNLILNFPVGGGTGVITARLNSGALLSPSNASFVITGGTCAQNVPGYIMRPTPFITGTYTGTLTGTNNSTAVAVSAVMVQLATPHIDGTFSVLGNMTLSGNGCNTLLAITGSTINGQPFTVTGISSASIGTVTPVGVTSVTSVASSLTISSLNASCSAGALSGTLNYVPGT